MSSVRAGQCTERVLLGSVAVGSSDNPALAKFGNPMAHRSMRLLDPHVDGTPRVLSASPVIALPAPRTWCPARERRFATLC